MTSLTADQMVFQVAEWHKPRQRRAWSILMLAAVFHAVVLLGLLSHTRLIEKVKVKGEQSITTLFFPQQGKPEPPAPPPPPPQAAPRPPVLQARPAPRKPQEEIAPAAPSPLPSLPPNPAAITQPQEEDMMARVEAARKRRQQQAPAESAPPPAALEDENQRRLQTAYANLAQLQRNAGRDKEDTGGVFQIRNQTYQSAEFVFRGWNSTMRRMWPQLYQVERGNEPDIELAIVKKMIEVIRKYKDGDFTWESQRLGRAITLSARPADSAQLQQFLLREFFPNYHQSNQ
ncbi:hypothetical protein V8J88_13925 [Massilia sp. W12]|uniref:hypothetical protein n=1 Tax=Massilia sp. W12 TaxID=3126507 RepID=UPI0030D2CF31